MAEHTKTNTNSLSYLLQGSALVLVAAFGFSSKSILIKLAYSYGANIDAVTVMVIRMLLSLPFFVIAAIWAGRNASTALEQKDWLAIFALGLMGYYLSSFLDLSGLAYISAGLERMILFIYPTLVLMITAFLYKRPVTRREVISLAICYTGIAFVFAANMHFQEAKLLLGGGLVFGATIAFAMFTIGSGHLIQRIGATRFTAYSMTIACIATTIHYSLVHGSVNLDLPVPVYKLGLLLAVLSTVIPSFLMSAGIRHIGARKASIITASGPISTMLLAYVFLNENITLLQLSGMALVVVGVLAISWEKSR